eukprot:EG_transcript_39939
MGGFLAPFMEDAGFRFSPVDFRSNPRSISPPQDLPLTIAKIRSGFADSRDEFFMVVATTTGHGSNQIAKLFGRSKLTPEGGVLFGRGVGRDWYPVGADLPDKNFCTWLDRTPPMHTVLGVFFPVGGPPGLYGKLRRHEVGGREVPPHHCCPTPPPGTVTD